MRERDVRMGQWVDRERDVRMGQWVDEGQRRTDGSVGG